VTQATFPPGATSIADAYWEGGTVRLTREQLAAGTKGPDSDGDGYAETITLTGTCPVANRNPCVLSR
jgi:hypothetical protein